MEKYIISVKPGKDCNPEFAPDIDLQNGVECEGFVIVTFKNGQAYMETMMGVSVTNMSNWIRKRSVGGNNIRKACAIAEGEIKALEIDREGAPEVTMEMKGLPKLSQDVIDKLFGRDRSGNE